MVEERHRVAEKERGTGRKRVVEREFEGERDREWGGERESGVKDNGREEGHG